MLKRGFAVAGRATLPLTHHTYLPTDEEHQAGIHGMKGAVPVWVGEPDPKKGVTAAEMAENFDMPIHPGAEKYYREAGLLKK